MLVFGDGNAPSGSTLDHVRSCASCQPKIARLRSILAEIATRTDDSAPVIEHVAESDLMHLADGDGPTRDQIAHLAACVDCRSELASLSNLLDDPQIAGEIRRAESAHTLRLDPRRSFALRAGGIISLAAAAAVLFMVRPHSKTQSVDGNQAIALHSPHRAPTITGLAAPVPTSPVGDVDGRPAFRWTSIAGADRYRVTVYDDTGRVIYESEVVATTVTLPDSVATIAGRSYVWQVEGRNGVDRWTPSELVEFRIAPRAR